MLRSAFSTFVVRSSSKAVRSHYPKVATAALTTAGITLGTAIYLRKESKHLIENLDDDGLPRTYIPEKMERYWDEQTAVIPLGRIIEIISIMFPFVCRLSFARMTGSLTTEADKEAYAQDFRRVLTDLGPCFIKFGQMLSIRPDVLPPVLVKELQKLCDNVPAYATSRALDLIEEQLGPGSVGELFEGLDKSSHPIAAASLGQVYKATLKMTGETVAIKVQRL